MSPNTTLQAARHTVARTLTGAVRSCLPVARGVLDLLYPPVCMACDGATAQSLALCSRCWGEMRFIAAPMCARLGTPLPQDFGAPLLSPEAIANPPVYRRARAVACFDDGPSRILTHRLKYGDRPDYARPLGLWMAQAGRDLFAAVDLIVPVPLHHWRLWTRRYNQAALLASVVAKATRTPVTVTALDRVRNTRSQVGMSRSERMANIQGAFKVSGEGAARVQGRSVLLVDDVLTTGSTVNAAARVLLRAGAANVDVLVFARVVTAG